MMCTGGIQTVVVDDAGAILQLGSPERCFTAHQRRAITLRDGGCLIPGCTVSAAWCEIHHVIPDESGGPTHIDNGVMLCWFHHRTIDTSGWQIRMLRGVPHIRPPAWLDPGGTWRVATKSPTRIADRLRRRRGRVRGEPRADEAFEVSFDGPVAAGATDSADAFDTLDPRAMPQNTAAQPAA
jgi:5-methylcytosine-specific restriction protein A